MDENSKDLPSTLQSPESDKAFQFQLKIIEKELDLINAALERTDKMILGIKNWSIVVWGGSVLLTVENESITDFLIYTSILPMLFWYVETWWRMYTAYFLLRQREISDFLNGDRLLEAFENKNLGDFIILDPASKRLRESGNFRKRKLFFANFFRAEVSFMYLGEILVSIVAGILILLN